MNQSKWHITASKQYCVAAGATQGNIAYTQTVYSNLSRRRKKHIAARRLVKRIILQNKSMSASLPVDFGKSR
jgi:hypothetical protein